MLLEYDDEYHRQIERTLLRYDEDKKLYVTGENKLEFLQQSRVSYVSKSIFGHCLNID